MKLSQFTSIVFNKDNYILFNSLKDKVMICNAQVAELIEANRDGIDAIADIHPELYSYLKDNEFIVDSGKDEAGEYERQIIAEDDSLTHCSITLNPTMDCNLSCWYCYEDHIKDSEPSPATMDAIRRLLSDICGRKELKSLTLSFFGGEPLMRFDKVVKPIVEHILPFRDKIQLTVGFTTNAVLLTKDIVDYLADTGVVTTFQIPFDGDRETHNKVKVDKEKRGCSTYDTTLGNLKYAVQRGLSVTVRCNYTSRTVDSFAALIDDVADILREDVSKVRFSFQQIWQDAESGGTKVPVDRLRSKVELLGAAASKNSLEEKYRCYADKKHAFVINYDGNIFQCTARKFRPEDREGYLCPDGTIIYNEKYDLRMKSRFSNKECRVCPVLPICNLCTQKRLEFGNSGCIFPDPTVEKHDMIMTYIRQITK